MIISDVNNAFAYDLSVVGGKAYGLFKLVGYGFRVPDFFVIGAGTDMRCDGFAEELFSAAEKLNCRRFAVRSSGVAEDGEVFSFAGQYRTELNVPADGLLDAVRKVCASSGAGGGLYASGRINAKNAIAVIVQKQIEGQKSGVLFSTAPQDADAVMIEQVCGAGESLVGGKVIPEILQFKKGERSTGYAGQLLQAAKVLEQEEGSPVDVEWTYDGIVWFLQLRHQTALSDDIPDLPDRDWNFYVYRDFTVFNHSVQVLAAQEDVQRNLFSFSVPVTEGLLVCGREFYSSRNDAAANAVWENADKLNFFAAFSVNIEKIVKQTKRRCAAVQKRCYDRMSDRALLTAYKREINYYIQSYVPMMMRPDDYLYGKLELCAGAVKARALIDAVKELIPPTYYSGERACFLRAVISGNSQKYLSQYEWLNNPLGKKFTPVTEKQFERRAQNVTPVQAKKLLSGLQSKKRIGRKRALAVLAQTDGETERLARLILNFIYYRTKTAENSDRYFYFIRKNLLSEICRRTGLDDQTLLLYRADEIAMLLNGRRLSGIEITKRKNGEAIFFFGGETKTYFGANAYTLLRKLLPEPEQTDGVRGQIACYGEVTGIVKVVTCFEEAAQMREGCIAVASMTTPDIVFALEKASGIITDEGGVTCHAAIIAREYAVPCLVGTRVATRVLSDGMRVRLDCINGIFRILN